MKLAGNASGSSPHRRTAHPSEGHGAGYQARVARDVFVALAAFHQGANRFQRVFGVFQLHDGLSFVLCDTKNKKIVQKLSRTRRSTTKRIRLLRRFGSFGLIGGMEQWWDRCGSSLDGDELNGF